VAVEGLEHFSKEQLIKELINRDTFVGVVLFHRGDAKMGGVEAGEIVMTKSPPLTREGVEKFLRLGSSLVSAMFGEESVTITEGSVPSLPLDANPCFLRLDEGGVVRVGKSRISLDLIVEQYENGLTPESMVRTYDSLVLADVYAAIAFYLQHRDEVRAYLKRRSEESETLRAKIEAEHPGIAREELMARRLAAEKDHASTGQ
jgi:uncharacterized protein (DUF433 family)